MTKNQGNLFDPNMPPLAAEPTPEERVEISIADHVQKSVAIGCRADWATQFLGEIFIFGRNFGDLLRLSAGRMLGWGYIDQGGFQLPTPFPT